MPEPEHFHRRGHHVQKAHGRRAATLATDGSHLSGAMIALMPTAEDAKRLAITGGEKWGDLHCTLMFLGGDATVFDEAARQEIIGALMMMFAEFPPITANIFGIAHWNAGSEDPSWVWSVGDTSPPECPPLEAAHGVACDAVFMAAPIGVMIPAQHTPWVAHVCAAYTDDLTLSKILEKRNGPVTFDRIRVSFGDEDTDIPLSGSMTAAGVPRRKLTDFEIQSRADFAMIDKQWDDAVGAALHDYTRAEAEQRAQLREQIAHAVDTDDLGSLDQLHVDVDHMASLLADHMYRLAMTAGKEMQREAEHQGVTVPEWDLNQSLTASTAADVLTSVARVTARALGLGLVRSAASRALTFVTSGRSGRQVAAKVDQDLKDLSTRSPREFIGTAMSSAQNTGRMAVLRVAPAGVYMATEVLDKNTCAPCRTIDGTEFTSLTAAAEAYPSSGGGYANCAGGGRCRGTMIAVWGSAEVGSAAQEVRMTTVTEPLGGKPNPGTNKDKRLKENPKAGAEEIEVLEDGTLVINFGDDCEGEDCDDGMAMASHLGISELVQAAWDGSPSRFTDAQYQAATAACDPGNGSAKERCFLPHHEPGGALNQDGLSAAAGRFSSLSGHSTAAVAKAKSHLRGHYTKLGKEVPSNLKATDEEVAAFALEDDYDLIIWGLPVEQFADDNGGCPPNMMKDPATGECGPMKTSGQTAPWEGVLVVEDQVTGDGREFSGGALTWADPIEPGEVLLRWNKEDSHGGETRTKAVTVGRIDSIWRDGNKIMGKGVFDLGSEDGAEAHRRVQDKFLRGVSIDADSIGNADVEFVWPESAGADGEDVDPLAMLFAQPDKVIYHGGRIRAATLCDIPAFAEAYIALVDDSGAVVAGGSPSVEEQGRRQSEITMARVKNQALNSGDRLGATMVAHGGTQWRPPAEWFENPQLSQPTTIHVTDDGRVFGHAAQWGACHIGFMDVCTQPPREDDFPYFATGELVTEGGKIVTVGQITVTANHADLYVAAGPAKEHYENTGNAIADVSVGADRIGIWVAGAIRPNADPMLVHELRASGEVSGDWRRIGGQHRLVGLLGVNVGGFVVPRMKARVAGGQVQALVAAGRLTTAHLHPAAPDPMDLQTARKIVMDDLASQMFGPDTEGSE